MKKLKFEICGKVTFKEKGSYLYSVLREDARETEKMKSEGLAVGTFFSRNDYKLGQDIDLCLCDSKLYEIT